MSEDAAKAAWLARLDAPEWGKAAAAMTQAVAEAAEMDALAYACDSGVQQACESLSREDDAKRAWLAKLDVPTWGAAAAAVTAVAAEVEMAPDSSAEEIAKQAWLARLDAPAWGSTASVDTSEDAAKAAWLARLDAPKWGQAATAMAMVAADASEVQALIEDCDAGDQKACDTLSNEDAAKAAWLSKLDVPSWGAAAAAVSAIASQLQTAAPVSEDAAKTAWLARLDVPAWGSTAGAAPAPAAYDAAPAATSEDAAKAAWLSKLDAPAWGR